MAQHRDSLKNALSNTEQLRTIEHDDDFNGDLLDDDEDVGSGGRVL